MNIGELTSIIVAAKAATYVGGGTKAAPSRSGSHDLEWRQGRLCYLDSYFGSTDFLGQEAIWLDDAPVWAMNYYGFILRPELIGGQRAGETIKAALTSMYGEGRFLGGFEWTGPHGQYRDTSAGDASHFHGRETITVQGEETYALEYFGGLIRL
ncbi:MAG: DUF5680 domain-containing protein [Candidatus Devosia euplotis]|nr:DUF5680 domain-containing protein [Candidatus Devosia euplotis]